MEDRILDAAYRVFVAAGFRGATTRRIAAEAGVNEVTLFRRFSSKEELLAAAIKRQSDRAIADLAAHPLPGEPRDLHAELRTYLTGILPAMLQARQAHRTTVGEWDHTPALNEHLLRTTTYVYDEVGRYLDRAQQTGLLRTDVNTVLATQTLLGALFADAMMRDMMPSWFPLDPEPAVDAYLDVLLNGLLPDGAR